MADYTPPSKGNILFEFTPGGYVAPDFGNITPSFEEGKTTTSLFADLQASIYAIEGVNLSASIRTVHESYEDLKFSLITRIKSSRDLASFVKIVAKDVSDITANVGAIPPANLRAQIKGTASEQVDLNSLLTGKSLSSLSNIRASLKIIRSGAYNLPSVISGLPAVVSRDVDFTEEGYEFPSTNYYKIFNFGAVPSAYSLFDPPQAHTYFNFDFTEAYSSPSFLDFYLGRDFTYLGATIKGVASGIKNLSASLGLCKGHGDADLRTFVKPTIQSTSDLICFIDTIVEFNFTTDTTASTGLNDIFSFGMIPPIYSSGRILPPHTYFNFNFEAPYTPPTFRDFYFRHMASLSSYIYSIPPAELPAYLNPVPHVSLGAAIKAIASGYRDIPASIDPRRGTGYGDLSAYIHQIYERNFPAFLRALRTQDLTSSIDLIPPADLTAYLQVWPQRDLTAYIRGWQELYLTADIQVFQARNLSVYMGGHLPGNLKGSIKGWVRAAYLNLTAYIRAEHIADLPVFIRGTELKNLTAYAFPVLPKDIKASVMCWSKLDLPASLLGEDYPWNLPASIFVSGGYRALSSSITGKEAVGNLKNLTAYILGTMGRQDFGASLNIIQIKNLSAFLDTGNDIRDLGAYINPNIFRLTTMVSIITMEHKDLSAVINDQCNWSGYRDLNAYIRTVFFENFPASITGKTYPTRVANLSASCGYDVEYVVIDKLRIEVYAGLADIRIEDKLKLSIEIFVQDYTLPASINVTPRYKDLVANVYGQKPQQFSFDNYKLGEKVFKLDRSGQYTDFENVEVAFTDMVSNYYFNSIINKSVRVNRGEFWHAEFSSYFSPPTAVRLERKLHKLLGLYNLRGFRSVDDYVKDAINHVTTDFYLDIGADIYADPSYRELTAVIKPKNVVAKLYDNLTCDIMGYAGFDYLAVFNDEERDAYFIDSEEM